MRVAGLSGISTVCNKEVGIPTFTKDDCISGYPSLIAGEEIEGMMRKIAHNKQQICGVNARNHKPGMFVDVFQVVLLSSVPR